MSKKYIRENKNSYAIVKSSKTYAKITDFDDAIFIRDFLVDNDWDLTKTPQILKKDDIFMVLTVSDQKIRLLGKYKSAPDEDTIHNLIKKHKRNPNNSRYGLNISKIFETFVIKKQIAGDDYIFGYYDNLADAEFVRNFLMDNSWNVNEFQEIEFDEETDTYKVVRVIDDKVYVLDSFKTKDIDLDETYGEFLAKISKQKYGLASYPYLDLLTDKIEELEKEFGGKAKDKNWNFDNAGDDPLKEVIFTLTPFQKSVYDAIDDKSTFDEIKKSLMRYKSKNFDAKINRNLDELIEMDLIKKEKEYFIKIN